MPADHPKDFAVGGLSRDTIPRKIPVSSTSHGKFGNTDMKVSLCCLDASKQKDSKILEDSWWLVEKKGN
jgi:hypothetical protein